MRRLTAALSALPLLLCAGTVALWVRGHFVSDDAGRQAATPDGHGSWWFVHAGRGRLLLVRHTLAFPPVGGSGEALAWGWAVGPPSADLPPFAVAAQAGERGWAFGGAEHRWRVGATKYGAFRYDWVGLPLWAPAAAFALLPGWLAYRWSRRRRQRGAPAFQVVRREG